MRYKMNKKSINFVNLNYLFQLSVVETKNSNPVLLGAGMHNVAK